tara:strand:- start:415 stop:798 length:384 start_codon:yes stop_codon:yes gene_type:complete
MKKLIYPLLTLSILFTIGCDDDKKEESVDLIIGTWTLSAVCGFEDENCSGICTDVTAMWFEDEGSFSITFSSDGTGTVNEGSFSWSGSGPYTLTVDGESTTINLFGDSITYNFEYEDNVCIQFTLTK